MAQEDSMTRDEPSSDGRHAEKAGNPAEISKPSWKYILKRTVHEFSKDQCTDLAAALTYYTVLATFPALLALVSILGLVGQGKSTVTTVLGFVKQVAPGQASTTLEGPITQLVQSPSAGITLIVGILGAIWSASGYVRAFGRSMNRMYEVQEGRPAWKLLPVQLLVTVVMILLAAAVLLMLVVSGPIARTLGDTIGLGRLAVTIWSIAKWPVLVFFAVIIIAILYYATSNVKPPKFRWMSMGALLALIVLAIVTVGFGFYVANFSSYNKTYGSIGGVIVLLLWIWLANLSLLFGAEFDTELERGRELQAGLPAERSLQLPLRGTRQIEKQRAKNEKDIEEGRALSEK